MASTFRLFSAFPTAAPNLGREFFTCRRCLRTQAAPLASRTVYRSVRQTPFLKAFRAASTEATLSPSALHRPAIPLDTLSNAAQGARKTSFFPDTSSKPVAYWLLGSAASVFGIVVFGGLTRLTESGLSITEWRPVTGSLPPMNAADWESEFSKYRNSPEYQKLNPNMDLAEFKKIYFMEWTHRLWGRVVGITALLPTIYFIARRRVSAHHARVLTAICLGIGFQGFLGWWMVKSGLKDDLFAPGAHPRVSQYRLAAHLGTAFAVYVTMLHTGLSILRENRAKAQPELSLQGLQSLASPRLRAFRIAVYALTALVFTTAMSGALVAGLDAGLIYNEFPYMGLGLTPPKAELLDPFYSRNPDRSDLLWRNVLENPSLVQLDHRALATTTFTAIVALAAWTRVSPSVRGTIGSRGRSAVRHTVYMALLQVSLGISTLLYLVPVPLAAAHQAGALALLSCMVLVGNRVWVPRRLMRLTKKWAEDVVKGKGSVGSVGLGQGRLPGVGVGAGVPGSRTFFTASRLG